MKKKLLLGITTLLIALSLISCGKNKTDVSYAGHSYEEYQMNAENLVQSLESYSKDQIVAQAEAQQDELSAGLFQDWIDCYDMKGDFVKFKEFSLEKTGKTLTSTLICDYTDRDLKVVYVFDLINDEITIKAIDIEPVYTLKETMGKAGLNTIMGIGIVFVMLVVMSLIIYCFKFVNDFINAKDNKNESEVKENAVAVASGEVEDDLQLVAVIAAAIAASTGQSTDSFVVRSIKKRY